MAILQLSHRRGSRTGQVDLVDLAVGASIIIGRDPLAAVSFPPGDDRMVSRRHARVECIAGEVEGWRLDDLGSCNGVFVNGERVAGAAMLRPGDEVMLGPDGPVLRVELPAA